MKTLPSIAITIAIFSIFLLSTNAHAQAPKVQTAAIYSAEVDDALTIHSLSVLPAMDNVGGIYSRPVEAHLKSMIEKGHQFKHVDSQFAGALVSANDLEKNPQQVKDISQNIDADALIAPQITKSPNGIQLQLSLFLKSDGQLVAKMNHTEKGAFDIKNMTSLTESLFQQLLKQIPYEGLVLSRNNNLVTINLGKKDGLQKGQLVTPILLVKVNRHPKLKFIISSEKVALGQIRLDKVDDTLSFGQIIAEKDRGAIQKNTKISGIQFVQNSDPALDEAFQVATPPNTNPTFGENPKEWRPSDPPTFGKLGVGFGLGQLRYNAQRPTGAGSLHGSANLFPSVKLAGELWLTSQWIANFDIEQGVMTLDNPESGSAPSELSVNMSNYLLSFGYNFMIQDDFFGPSILLSLGYASYGLDVDTSNNAGGGASLTSTNYSGLFFGIKGTVPVSANKKWNLGGSLKYFLRANLTESPAEQSSGSNDNTMTQFSIIGFYQKNTKLRFTTSLDFALFSTKFDNSGPHPTPAIDSSQKYTMLTGGIEFLF